MTPNDRRATNDENNTADYARARPFRPRGALHAKKFLYLLGTK